MQIMFNMFWDRLDFDVPGRRWCVAVDTAEPSPHDIADPGSESEVFSNPLPVEARSAVVLLNRV